MLHPSVQSYVPSMEEVFPIFAPPMMETGELEPLYAIRLADAYRAYRNKWLGGTMQMIDMYLGNPEDMKDSLDNRTILCMNAMIGAPIGEWSGDRRYTEQERDAKISTIPLDREDFFITTASTPEQVREFYRDGLNEEVIPDNAAAMLADHIVRTSPSPAVHQEELDLFAGPVGPEPPPFEPGDADMEDPFGYGAPPMGSDDVSNDIPVPTEDPVVVSPPPASAASPDPASVEPSASAAPPPPPPPSIPFQGLFVPSLSHREVPAGDAAVVPEGINAMDGYVSYSHRLYEEAQRGDRANPSDLSRLYAQRIKNAEYVEASDAYIELIHANPEYAHQLPSDVHARRIIGDVCHNATSAQAVDGQIDAYLKKDTPASGTLDRLGRSYEGFRSMLAEGVDDQRLAMVVGSMAHHAQHLMESPEQVVDAYRVPGHRSLLDLAVTQRYKDGIADIERQAEPRPRADQYLRMVLDTLDSGRPSTPVQVGEREAIFLKMQANPRDSLQLAQMVSHLPSDTQDTLLGVMREDAYQTRDRHPNMHYAESIVGLSPERHHAILDNFQRMTTSLSTDSLDDAAQAYALCVKQRHTVGRDTPEGQAWADLGRQQVQEIFALGSSQGLRDMDLSARVMMASDRVGVSRVEAATGFRGELARLAEDRNAAYDPDTGERVDTRDRGFSQRTPSIWRDAAVGPQFPGLVPGEDEDVTFKARQVPSAPGNTEPQAPVQLSADEHFWKGVSERYTEQNSRGIFYKRGTVVNQQDGFSADLMVAPFLSCDARRVRTVLQDKYSPAFALPLTKFGESSVGSVRAGIRQMLQTPEGRQRVSDMIEGTRNMRNAIVASGNMRNLSETDQLRHDQLEMGYRALVSAVGGGRGRHAEFDGVEGHITPFISNQGDKVMKLNERHIHGVQLSRDNTLVKDTGPGFFETTARQVLRWKASHLFCR